ncbi:uncharacterized protein [Polyergus mexicanus]|uniref:uncharacterized protein n=1 Tax=Polyergus mexicanus TaxID=615972 RepID=UPI0038B57C87
MVVELPESGEKEGPTAAHRADALMLDLSRVFTDDNGVRLARPIRKAELRLRGLDRSLTAAEIAAAIARMGGCLPEEVRVGDTKFPAKGMGTVWAQCPLKAANVATARTIQIKWSRVAAELLEKRPLQCYKCLERGHVQQHCSSRVDRCGCCYRCGEMGHLARNCASNVRCPVCAELGRPADHRANLNHARRAQDLFLHTLAERGCGLGIAAEPYRVPEASPCWIGDGAGSVAITWKNDPLLLCCTPIEAGRGVVAVRWGPISVVGCYISPNVDLAHYEAFFDGVAAVYRRQLPRPVIVAGDFNAKSTRWGSRLTDARGEVLQDWATALGLCLLNTRSRSTLVRWRGESVPDLSWATPAAARVVSSWRVATECETLSDHLYIEVVLTATRHGVLSRSQGRGDALPRRWALKKLNSDRLIAAVLAADWPCPGGEGRGIQEQVDWFRGALRDACDFAMPRTKPRPRRPAYWWCEEIAELRRFSVAARRRFTRARRRKNAERTASAYEGFRVAWNALSAAIRPAKARGWDELLRSLNSDSWGRPYKLVLNRLRSWAPPVTESLEPQVLDEVLGALFPLEGPPFSSGGGHETAAPWTKDLEVTGDKMAGVIRRLRSRGNKAPGPDGIPGRVWVLALDHLSERLSLGEGQIGPHPKGERVWEFPFRLSVDMPAGRGGQAAGALAGGPPRPAPVPGWDGSPPGSVWIPRGKIDH